MIGILISKNSFWPRGNQLKSMQMDRCDINVTPKKDQNWRNQATGLHTQGCWVSPWSVHVKDLPGKRESVASGLERTHREVCGCPPFGDSYWICYRWPILCALIAIYQHRPHCAHANCTLKACLSDAARSALRKARMNNSLRKYVLSLFALLDPSS